MQRTKKARERISPNHDRYRRSNRGELFHDAQIIGFRQLLSYLAEGEQGNEKGEGDTESPSPLLFSIPFDARKGKSVPK